MPSSRQNRGWKLGLASILAIGGAITSFDRTLAQITPDSTLGSERSVVTPTNINNLPSDQIDGGAKRGANLFHSFREFNVSAGRGAYFTNAVGIENIISRVTGSNPSNIFGKLGVLGNANLFLINPNGIIFGPNASLDVSGSFVASTASSMKFADGTEFSATAPQTTTLLTVSVPIGLQFGSSAADINLNGSGLTVQPGNTLALIGGNITLSGGDLAAAGGTNLEASGGRIELGSVAENSLVSITSTNSGWNFGYGGVQNFKDIQLIQGAFVDIGGEGIGNVQGRSVTIQDGSQIAANTGGSKSGGALTVRTSDSVELNGTTPDGQFLSGLFAQVNQGDTGNAGTLTIETAKLLIQNGAAVSTSTFGTGNAGNLTVRASDSVKLTGTTLDGQTSSGLFTQVNQGATGNAGNLIIETGRLTVLGGAEISTASQTGGRGGKLTINASDSIQLSGTSPTASIVQQSGASPVVTILGSSGVFVSAQPGSGANSNAGELTINTGRLTVEDGAEISADSFSPAQGGNATLNVRQLIVRNGGLIGAGAFGKGSGGSLNVNATDSVEVSGTTTFGSQTLKSILFTGAESSGNAGDLNITTGNLNVRDGGAVTVSSTGSGKAGNLQLTAGSIGLDNGSLTSTTFSGDGGNITLQGQNLLLLRHGSQISTNTAGTAGSGGNGGNITLNTPLLVAIPSENSDISANAFTGNGGQVTINTTGIFGTGFQKFDTPQSDITASSQFGVNGTVNINAPNVNPSNGLVTLPAAVVDRSRLIAQSCGAGDGTTANEFTVTGRGGLPPNPGEVLSRNVVLADTRLPATTAHPQHPATVTAKPSSDVVSLPAPATGIMFNGKGQVTLIAAAPTAKLKIPWLSPYTCRVN